MPLAELQARVMDALRHGGSGADALLPPAPPFTPAQRLQVYRNNMRQGLTDALAAVYPVVQRLVGEAFFRQAARAYIGDHPPRSGCVQDFGAALPAFLQALPACAALPYVGDLAALEWACHEAYHQAELPALPPARLAAVAPAQQAGLQLALQPSARFVASRYPVLAIWQANQQAEVPALSLDAGADRLLVVQQGLEVEFRRLGVGEDRWLRALAAGRGLGEATAEALDAEPAFDLPAVFGRHVLQGLFTGLSTGPGAGDGA
jgi:hypothetical protein